MPKLGKPPLVELRVQIRTDTLQRLVIAASARGLSRSELVQEVLDLSPALNFRLPDVPEPQHPRTKTPRSS